MAFDFNKSPKYLYYTQKAVKKSLRFFPPRYDLTKNFIFNFWILCYVKITKGVFHDMKCSIKKQTYRAIYRLLDRVSPVSFDCGLLCGSACCTCGQGEDDEEAQLGIYLLPGEDKLFTKKEDWLHWEKEDALDYDFPDSWFGTIYFVTCLKPPHCERRLRPLQCRFFPLAPHLDSSGRLRLILSDLKLPYRCPLIFDSISLNPSFIQATYTVWSHLIRDSLIYDLVEYDSSLRREDHLKFLR